MSSKRVPSIFARRCAILLLAASGCSPVPAGVEGLEPFAAVALPLGATGSPELAILPSSGIQGTVVSITGSGLASTASVTFAGIPARFTALSDVELRANVPLGANNDPKLRCPVVVNRAGGASSTVKFVVVPAITSFSPAAAASGAPITINGSDFRDGSLSLTIAGVRVAVYSVLSDSQISAIVPSVAGGSAAIVGPIIVRTPGGDAISTAAFEINPGGKPLPSVILTPGTGIQGSPAKILGGRMASTTRVTFGGIPATFTVLSDAELRVVVPAGANNGAQQPWQCPVVVTRAGGETSTATFGVFPWITSFSPAAAASGAQIMLSGSDFRDVYQVTIAGVTAAFTVLSDSQIQATVPAAGLVVGPILVLGRSGPAAQSSSVFETAPGARPLASVDVTPDSGIQGSTAKIIGNGLASTSRVAFGGVAAAFTVLSDAELQVKVPAGANNGPQPPWKCPVVVTRVGGATSTATFGVLPWITSFSPAAAASGAQVMVSGSDFRDVQQVTIAGTTAAFRVISDSQIRATVPTPPGTSVGPIIVTARSGFSGWSAGLFEINPPPAPAPRITSLSPSAGSVGAAITISGSGFADVSGVSFGGVRATSYTVISYSSLTAVVPPGAITGPVSVSTAGGIAVSPGAFVVRPRCAPMSFAPAVSYATGTAPDAQQAADVNRDGLLDLVSTDYFGGLRVLLGNPDGTFADSGETAGGIDGMYLSLGDVDGDGRLDAAVADYTGGTVAIVLGRGDGTFRPAIFVPVPDANVTMAELGDANGDGRLDLAVGINKPGHLHILLGNGDGTFGSPTATYDLAGTPFESPAAARFADVNGDGRQDLLVANQGTVAAVLIGHGDGTFAPPVRYEAGIYPQSIVVRDINGDGALDMLVASVVSGQVSVLLGNGDGSFQPHLDVPVGAWPYSLAVDDFDGDGRLDVATANGNDNTLSIVTGNGDGTFSPALVLPTGPGPRGIVSGDFDHDGRADLAVNTEYDAQDSVLLNACRN